jgi:hypothetical protein
VIGDVYLTEHLILFILKEFINKNETANSENLIASNRKFLPKSY